MAQQVIAPWADIVEDAPPMTADDLLDLSAKADAEGDPCVYELVEGRLVRTMPADAQHGDIVMEIGFALQAFVKPRRLGRIYAAETGFIISGLGGPDTVLAADVAFVRMDRLPPRNSLEYVRYLRLAPDLVGEMPSPTQYRPEITAKVQSWLGGGVRLVWVAWPQARTVEVWRPDHPDAPMATLADGDSLDGLDVLPGFRYPIAQLFAGD